MRISIVVTTFRRPEMLAGLLGALQSQLADRPVEVIVIDNCPDGSARAVVERCDIPAVRYCHELRSGVVHARNRGVAESGGTYIVFLDDDEVPHPGWIDAWLVQTDDKTDMSFGRIQSRPLGPCPSALAGQVDRLFSRDLRKSTGTDISTYWAYLGTGNAMFHKLRCFPGADPFDIHFNTRGGEDIWLIRSLARQGRSLVWNQDALVDELVPKERMTLLFLKTRKFNQGQLRCIFVYGEGGVVGTTNVLVWMVVGAVQLILFTGAAMVTAVVAPMRTPNFICRAYAGAGKLLWWRASRLQHYAKN